MLLFITQFLQQFVGAFRVFDYVSFRALMACFFAMVLSLSVGNQVIAWLINLKVGQAVRMDGPKTHLSKTGTPTMGGVLIILTVLITNLLFADLRNLYIWLLLFVLVSTGAIGFIDDYLKVTKKNSRGLSGRFKLLWQSAITLIVLVCIALLFTLHGAITTSGIHDSGITANSGAILGAHAVLNADAITTNTANGNNFVLLIPFFKGLLYHYGLIGFLLFGWLVIVGSSNAVNLTDGLDGLVSFPIITVTLGLTIFAYIAGNKILASYALLPHIVGAHEIVVFCGSLVGACLGFLWFNAHPARVFMGDVGALAIGATLGTVAVIIRQEIAFAIMAGLFVMEALSVMIQVGFFKLYKKRIFRMAPIHHHFELKGWQENQVVVRFWIISIMLLLLSLATIKLR